MPKHNVDVWLQLHHDLFEQVPCSISVIDRDFNVVTHNRMFAGIFGEARGAKCFRAYKRREGPCADCMAVRTFEDGRVRVNEETGVDHGGQPAHYVVHMAPIFAADGRIAYVIEMSTDITEMKKLQREYQVLFDRVPCYVAVLNKDFRIVKANARLQETFGRVTGQHCYEIYKHRAERCDTCPAERTFIDGKIHRSEQTGVTRRGEETHYIVTTSPVPEEDGRIHHVIEMALDATEMRKLQKEKLGAERLAAVGQTVAGLAHGIKNILMGLEGGMYVMDTGIRNANRDRIQNGWSMLERNITKITSLVRDMLSFSKGRPTMAVPTDPNQLVRDVVELFRDAAGQAGLQLVVELEEGLPAAALDPEGIHACLANLVSNAFDACQLSEKPACRIVLRTCQRAGSLIFEVEDTGCGLEYDVKQKVFTTFFTTKGTEGTGLGLLMTRKIVQEHGGKLSMETEQGKGSVFRMVFPLENLPHPQPAEP